MAMILSAAMMLRYTFGQGDAADAIEQAVQTVLQKGYRTADLLRPESGQVLARTEEIGKLVAEAI